MYSILYIGGAYYVYAMRPVQVPLPNSRMWARFDTPEDAIAYRKGLR